jgi:hypothetical protein
MNNLFYEFLEKNHLQGLEDNLSTLNVFNEAAGRKAIDQLIPENANFKIITVETMSITIVFNGKIYTLCLINSGRNLVILPGRKPTTATISDPLIETEIKKILLHLLLKSLGKTTTLTPTQVASYITVLSGKKFYFNGKDMTPTNVYLFKGASLAKLYNMIALLTTKRLAKFETILRTGANDALVASLATDQNVLKGATPANSQQQTANPTPANSQQQTANPTPANSQQQQAPTNAGNYQRALGGINVKKLIDSIIVMSQSTNNKIFDYLKGKSYFDNKIDASKNNKGAYGQSTPAFKKAYDQIYGIYPALKKELKAAGYTGQTPINDFITDYKANNQQDKAKFEWFMENVVSKHFTLKRIFNS